ncbi:MAG TPA: F0F1 ATP synthase subunit A [Gemmatimonadaceae bacterium]|nr:F0F1 ATP synthase subunit A [Gemmatimonadaceae bacterium]
MRSFGRFIAFALLAAAPLAVRPATLAAQEGAKPAEVDIITPHITDSYELEIPWLNAHFAKEVCIGRHLPNGHCGPLWEPIGHIGPMEVNLSPTKHVVMLLLAALISTIVLVGAARAHGRHSDAVGHPKGFAAGVEAMVLYIRNEVILPNVGHHGNAYVPFGLTLFFFILTANLLGLIPFGSTATGNIAVTATLAIITFFVVEVSGMKAQGAGYLNTIFYWNKELPLLMRVLMFVIMTPVEMLGKLAKPFALAVRLFANMTAGHIVVLALIGLIFTFKSWAVAGGPFIMAVLIMMLELFVALLQAYIFTLLSSVFIGLIREGGH